MSAAGGGAPSLQRALGLPLLVFYGLGVTIGAGIFALVGEILGAAGDFAPLAFLIAGLVAGGTARAYSLLSRRYPKAAGSALYAREAFGRWAAWLVGLSVAVTGVVSSGVITLAFAEHVTTLVPVPDPVVALGLLGVLAAVASLGVRESLVFAAAITVIEVGTLLVVALAGAPALADGAALTHLAALPSDRATLDITIAAATIAFFAFIGFEDIVNMAEEAKDPVRTMGPAIAITLAVSTLLYVTIAAIAAASPDRASIATSDAPLATLFGSLTGLPPEPITVIASVSMVNGVLVQIVMASRVLYGMANEGLLPAWLAAVAPVRRTPVRATMLVTAAIGVLVLAAPMLALAQVTGYLTLAVFLVVNLSLFVIAGRAGWPGSSRQRWWGIVGALFAGGLLLYEAQRQFLAG